MLKVNFFVFIQLNSCVNGMYSTDNTSDHESIILQLTLKMNAVGFHQRIHAPRASWAKATDFDCDNYRRTLWPARKYSDSRRCHAMYGLDLSRYLALWSSQ